MDRSLTGRQTPEAAASAKPRSSSHTASFLPMTMWESAQAGRHVRLHEVCAEGPNQAIARTNVTLRLEAALI
jgi:hypothetical protein